MADSHVALLNMNRPETKNAIGRVFLDELRSCIAEANADSKVRVVVLASAVQGAFCAGADLKERVTMSKPEVAVFVTGIRAAFSELSRMRVPTIAAINGPALGGGLEMALACDLRVAGPLAKIGLTETKLAIIPGAGGTQRLPRLIGASRAKELIFTGRLLDSQQAFNCGLVNHVCSVDALTGAAALAREIENQGPVALEMAKKAIDTGMQVDLATGMDVESACYAQIIPTKDRLEGLAAFKEKRKPVYIGE